MKVYAVLVTADGGYEVEAIFARREDAEAEAERRREEYRAGYNGWTRWWVEEWAVRERETPMSAVGSAVGLTG